MVFKAVLFDIGGVIVGSPIVGAMKYELLHSLPSNYLNVGITAQGKTGAFQLLEEGKLNVNEFYERFGRELSEVKRGGEAYRRYCQKMGLVCPDLPTSLKIDGKELWTMMMAEAGKVDDLVIEAIVRLKESQRYKIAALTNNFHSDTDTDTAATSSHALPSPRKMSIAQVKEALRQEREGEKPATGAPNEILRSLFDEFVESAVEGLRKPNPAFYQIALDKLGVQAEETIFLDDIGINLVAAREMGITTIRVLPGRSREAIEELERLTGVELIARESKLKL